MHILSIPVHRFFLHDRVLYQQKVRKENNDKATSGNVLSKIIHIFKEDYNMTKIMSNSKEPTVVYRHNYATEAHNESGEYPFMT